MRKMIAMWCGSLVSLCLCRKRVLLDYSLVWFTFIVVFGYETCSSLLHYDVVQLFSALFAVSTVSLFVLCVLLHLFSCSLCVFAPFPVLCVFLNFFVLVIKSQLDIHHTSGSHRCWLQLRQQSIVLQHSFWILFGTLTLVVQRGIIKT